MLVLLILCLCLAGCGGNKEKVLTIGVYSGSYWNTPNGNCYQILDDAIAIFEQSHPGVKVEYANGIPAGSYSEWLAEQILKGTEPDVYFVLPEDFDLLVSSGALAQLDERIAADPDFDTSLYYESCLRSGQFKGSQYALLHESVPTIMFVNKTLLEANGIEMPDNDWTWDDFYNICARDFDVGHVAFQPLLYSEYRAYQPYPWRVKKYSAFQWDCVSMPAGPSGSNISELHTMMLEISSRTRHGDLAWEFCKLLSINEEVQRKLYTSSHGISPLRAVAEDPQLLQQIHHDIPEGSGFSPDMIHRIMDNAVVVSRFDAYDQAMNMVESAIQEAANNQLDQSKMLVAQSEINIFLNKS